MKNLMLAPLWIAALLAVTPAQSATIPLPVAAQIPDILAITNEHGDPLDGTQVTLPFDASTGRLQTWDIPFKVFSNATRGIFNITITGPRLVTLKSGTHHIQLSVFLEGADLGSFIKQATQKSLYPNVVVSRSGAASRLLKLTVKQMGPNLAAAGQYTGQITLTVKHKP